MNRKQKRKLGIKNNYFSKRPTVEKQLQVRMLEQVVEKLKREEAEQQGKEIEDTRD